MSKLCCINKKAHLIFLLIILMLSIFIYSLNYNSTIGDNQRALTKENITKIKTAGFWDLTGSPILIDDEDALKNWVATAATYDWCSGSGSWSDPFLIENVTIDGQGTDNGIEIRNSDVYFILKNNTFYNGNDGIYLYYTNNGRIIENNVSNNINGIDLSVSDNNTLYENIINQNTQIGVYLTSGCSSNKVWNNTANGNRRGIYLYASWGSISSNSFWNNTANNNEYGLDIGDQGGLLIIMIFGKIISLIT